MKINLEKNRVYNYNIILEEVWRDGISLKHSSNFINNLRFFLGMTYRHTMELYEYGFNEEKDDYENKKVAEIDLLVSPYPFNYAKIEDIRYYD